MNTPIEDTAKEIVRELSEAAPLFAWSHQLNRIDPDGRSPVESVSFVASILISGERHNVMSTFKANFINENRARVVPDTKYRVRHCIATMLVPVGD